MTSVPRTPFLLGFAGLIPFLWGALTVLMPQLALWGAETIGARYVGPYLQLFYGGVILAFMSGVLWGFATKAEGRIAPMAYVLSVVPALWAFFVTGGGPVSAALNLIAGYLALLLLDWQYSRWGLTPAWWMPLRVTLTLVVVLCLLTVVL